jgi:hypothetical protein
MVEYSARVPGAPTLAQVIDATLAQTRPPHASKGHAGLAAEVASAVYARSIEALLTLAADGTAAASVRGIAAAKLDEVKRHADSGIPLEAYLAHRIEQFENEPAKFVAAAPVPAPPGMPIGDGEDF